MASAVDICNLALSHLGDTATVADIDPPEGSAQAEHCARFYPIARDMLLEMHNWNFSTRRAVLALTDVKMPPWDYVYEAPQDLLNVIEVMPPDMTDEYSIPLPISYTNIASINTSQGLYVPASFEMETDDTGRALILTDQEDAVLRYTSFVEDTTRFSPLFVTALSWKLAAMLAGPLIKGDAGAAEAKRCEVAAQSYLSQAMQSDANQRRIRPTQSVGWMINR